MSKCLCCETSKIFLKLTHGLCDNCLNTLTAYENRYKELLTASQRPNSDVQMLIPNLLSLSIDLRRFDEFSRGIKSSDCEKLISLLTDLDKTNEPLHNSQVETISNPIAPPLSSTVENSVNKVSTVTANQNNNHFILNKEVSSIEDVPISKNSTYDNIANTLSPDESEDILDIGQHILSDLDEEINIEESIPPSIYLDDAQNIKSPIKLEEITSLDLPTAIKENETVNSFIHQEELTSSNSSVEVIETISNELEVNEPLNIATPEPIKPIVLELSDIDKEEIQKIINTLNSFNLSVDEKCYYAFLLRNKYLPILKSNNITTIFDTNIEDLISKTLNNASLTLKCDVNEIYSFYNYVAFSIQTTGIHLNSNYIIELAAVRVSFGQVEETFHTLINPEASISLANEKKTGLTNLALSNAPTLNIVLQDFKAFAKGLSLVTHNANFNYKFIDINYQKLFNEPLNLDVLCTVKLYRKRYKQFHGEPTKDCSLYTCCNDLLNKTDLDNIDNSSIALSSALGTFKLYEIIKFKYK